MINQMWSGKNKAYWLLLPLSFVYGGIIYIRKWLYQIGIFKSWRAPVPVIIVGNLSVGGNGKTPVVICLVQYLQQKGFKVGVVSRGYGGKSEHYPLLVTIAIDASIAGDEPVLICRRTGAPLAIAPKRSDAVKLLLQQYDLDIIVTDDGLQHYALQRDIEIVVIDGKRGFGNGLLLPAGPMRELTSRLACVDFIIVNGKNEQSFTTKTRYLMTLEPNYAINLVTGEQRVVTDFTRVHAMAGIGDPERFFTMLKQLQVNVVQQTPFSDHQAYSASLLQQYISDENVVLMTEKDAVKCQSFAQNNWWYVPVEAQLPPLFFEKLDQKIAEFKSVK